MTPPCIYRSLDPAKKEIRLLELLPAPPDKQIYASCRLSTVSLLDDKPRFAALSYVWGDPSVTNTILLNGIRWQVTKNLAEALKCLTPKAQKYHQWGGKTLWLWADAVCINQKNDPERSQQVSLMADLYSSAHFVYSWL
ncbi:HET-domain-containing protein, partial [Mytilinidion resinicola]